MLDKRFRLNLDARPNPKCVVQGEKYRFTVLTAQMLRMEYDENGAFEDRPTQVVWNRNFDCPEFTVSDREDCLEIDTEYFHMVYDKKEFSPNHLYIDVKYAFTNYGGRWYYGRTVYGDPPREHNLKGTARTLDRCDGPWYKGGNILERVRTLDGRINREEGDVDLGRGLCDSSGRTFFEDGASLTLDEDGWVHPRKKGCIDTYFLGYGRDYFKAIHDFYQLSGPVPLLPRYALGNWWSRYWKYTEESYKELLMRFEELEIPFSVVVMDMDWHLVDIPEQFGKGWTGYTWNKEFFPDPARFLKWLHQHNYRITLNLHPADGVRAFEEPYVPMARALGVDPDSGYPVAFDFTSIEFIEAYFKYLHRPNEQMGVDFWWMDWQQGNISAVEGMDPMWMLNHYHHYDLASTGKRGIMLSRYSGLGSHRYPIGFSGDVHVTWESLQYQPYFTATAANVGYTWWSHDIGGHMGGIKDHELYVRWLQFGVFSPINRLHSNSSPFGGKEPWRYPAPYEGIAEDTLRLRHRLLPYLYTMNYQCHEQLKPAVVPAYYYCPMERECYRYKNEYFFGTELLVIPMVHPTDRETGYTTEAAWIPAGTWTDFFEGQVYHGGSKGRHGQISRPINRQGVLAKAGAIVPMGILEPGDHSTENPESLEILIFPGADNAYVMYEDEGDGFGFEEGRFVKTHMELAWTEDRTVFTLYPEGNFEVLPRRRRYILRFRGFRNLKKIQASERVESSYDPKTRTLSLAFTGDDPGRALKVELAADQGEGTTTGWEDLKERIFMLLDSVQCSTEMKTALYQCFEKERKPQELLGDIHSLYPPRSLEDILVEMLSCL